MSAREEDTAESMNEYLLHNFSSGPVDWGHNSVFGYEERRSMLSGGVNIRLGDCSLSEPSVGLRSLLFPATVRYKCSTIPSKNIIKPELEGEILPDTKILRPIREIEREIERIDEMETITGIESEMGSRATTDHLPEEDKTLSMISKVSFMNPIDSCGSSKGQRRKTRLEALRLYHLSRQPESPVVEVLYIHPNHPSARYTNPQMIFMPYYPGRTPFSEFMQLGGRQLGLINQLNEHGKPLPIKELIKSVPSERLRILMSDIHYLAGLGLIDYSIPPPDSRGDEFIELSKQAQERFIFNEGRAYDRTYFRGRRTEVTRMCLEALVQFHKTADSLKSDKVLRPSQLSEEEALDILIRKLEEIVRYKTGPGVAQTLNSQTLRTIRNELIHPLYAGRKSKVVVGDANNSNFIAVTDPYNKLKGVRVIDVFHCRLDDGLSDFVDFLQAQEVLSGISGKEYRNQMNYALELDGDFKGYREMQSFLRRFLPKKELYRALFVLGAIAGESNHLYKNPRHHHISLSEKQSSLHVRFLRYYRTVLGMVKRDVYGNKLRSAVMSALNPRH